MMKRAMLLIAATAAATVILTGCGSKSACGPDATETSSVASLDRVTPVSTPVSFHTDAVPPIIDKSAVKEQRSETISQINRLDQPHENLTPPVDIIDGTILRDAPFNDGSIFVGTDLNINSNQKGTSTSPINSIVDKKKEADAQAVSATDKLIAAAADKAASDQAREDKGPSEDKIAADKAAEDAKKAAADAKKGTGPTKKQP